MYKTFNILNIFWIERSFIERDFDRMKLTCVLFSLFVFFGKHIRFINRFSIWLNVEKFTETTKAEKLIPAFVYYSFNTLLRFIISVVN